MGLFDDLASSIAALGFGSRRSRTEEAHAGDRRILEEAARELGLELLEAADPAQPLLGIGGVSRGYHVQIANLSDGTERRFGIRIERPGAIPSELSIVRWSGLHDPLGLGTGAASGMDGPFMRVEGDALVRALLLDDDSAALLNQVVGAGGAVVRDGVVSAELSGVEVDRAALVAAVDRALEAARVVSFAEPRVARRIFKALEREADPVVRAHLLERLVQHFPDDDRTRPALMKASREPDPRVRFAAAIGLGEAGIAVLSELICLEAVDADIRTRALDHLATRAPAALPALLAAALAAEHPHVLARALDLLSRAFLPEGFDVTALEPRLVVLTKHGEAAVATGAIAALGRYGTIAAVEPLRDLAKTKARHRDRAERAIEWIQHRAKNAEPGGLALTEPNAGAGDLSLAEAPEGQLALAAGERDRR